jgi:dCMP deaminase
MMSRPTIHQTMLQVAEVLSRRSTCAKRSVGCVITDYRGRILSTGYNGAPQREKHCIDDNCPAVYSEAISCEAIHAEVNAIMQCRDADKISYIYITIEPCNKCLMLIKNTTATQIITPEGIRIL